MSFSSYNFFSVQLIPLSFIQCEMERYLPVRANLTSQHLLKLSLPSDLLFSLVFLSSINVQLRFEGKIVVKGNISPLGDPRLQKPVLHHVFDSGLQPPLFVLLQRSDSPLVVKPALIITQFSPQVFPWIHFRWKMSLIRCQGHVSS